MKKKRVRRKKPSRVSSENDTYTAADPLAEEDTNPSKFDAVFRDAEIQFDSEKEDEEIDENLAFTAEDEEQFSHVFEKEGDEMQLDPDLVLAVHRPNEMDALFGSDEDMEELSTGSEEEDAEGVDLRTAVLGSEKRKKSIRVQTEARPESILNMPVDEEEEIKGDRIADLIGGVGSGQTSLKHVRKSLEVLEKHNPLSVPLPKRIQDRQIRKAGYAHAVDDLSKWDDLVFANRLAPTLEFCPPGAGLERPQSLEDIVDSFEPESQMERDIAAMLESTGAASEESIVKMEDEHALKSMTLDELKKRRGQLAKMRSLLFQHEIKAQHVKKIKSKEYHRRLQRSIRKKALKFGGLDNDEAAKKMLEEMAYNRMKERLTQKHSTMNRFARRIMRRGWGVADEQTRQSLEEQLRQNQELKQKIQSVEKQSSDEEDSSRSIYHLCKAHDATGGVCSEGNNEDAQPEYRKTRKALMKVLEGDGDPDDLPKKGLIGLPFMQKAMQKQKEQTQQQATKMLREIDGTRGTEEENAVRTRLQFAGGVSTREAGTSDSEVEDSHTRTDHVESRTATRQRSDKTADAACSSLEGEGLSAEDKGLSSHHGYLFRSGRKERTVPDANPVVTLGGITNAVKGVTEIVTIEGPSETPFEEDERDVPELTTGNAANSEPKERCASNLTQAELIQMAFTDDNVHDEFEKEKETEVGEELPKMEEISLLPGWGRWKDEHEEPKWMQEKRAKNTRMRGRATQKRKDAKKPFVFISEKPNEKLDKYKASSVPHTFASAAEYKASLRHPIGPDFNTASAFDDFIRPKVLKRKGVIIEPLKLGQSAKTIREHVKELKEGNVKVRKIMGGEVRGQLQVATSDDLASQKVAV